MIQINLITKQKETDLEKECMVVGGGRWEEGIVWEFRMDYKHCYV